MVSYNFPFSSSHFRYHYQALPLRHLILAVDPDSFTSPASIIDRWNTETDLNGVVWNDDDYRTTFDMRESLKTKVEALKNNDFDTLHDLHNHRQNVFYGQCLRYLKAKGRSWVALIDSDEFIAFNIRYGYSDSLDTATTSKEKRTELPSAHETTVSEFINNNTHLWNNTPCIPMTRTLFGPKLNPRTEIINAGLPLDFNPDDFNTLKYFYHDALGIKSWNGFLKVMVDVRRFSDQSLQPNNIFSVHRPVIANCPKVDIFLSPEADTQSVWRVHH